MSTKRGFLTTPNLLCFLHALSGSCAFFHDATKGIFGAAISADMNDFFRLHLAVALHYGDMITPRAHVPLSACLVTLAGLVLFDDRRYVDAFALRASHSDLVARLQSLKVIDRFDALFLHQVGGAASGGARFGRFGRVCQSQSQDRSGGPAKPHGYE